MEPENSLPVLQMPTTCSYPEPDQSRLHLPNQCFKDTLQYHLPITLSSSELSLSSRIYHQSLASIVSLPIPAPYPAHLILLDLINEITVIF